MLTELEIKGFRGLKDLKISPLKRVNLIMGQNNAGKTGVLESLALLLWNPPSDCGNLPTLFRTVGGNYDENFWKWLFYNRNLNELIQIRGEFLPPNKFEILLSNKPLLVDRRVAWNASLLGQLPSLQVYTIGKNRNASEKVAIFSTHPTNPRQDAMDYNRVVLRRKKKRVEELLRKIEPRLEAIESLQTGDQPLLYADIGLSEMIPVTQMGQGFNRLLDIYSEIVSAEATVLLIDEIENGLHHSVLATVWKGLFEAAQELGVQIFATTHSWECVLAADEAARAQKEYELNLIRLDRKGDDVKATIIERTALETAKELHWEMR